VVLLKSKTIFVQQYNNRKYLEGVDNTDAGRKHIHVCAISTL